MAEERSDQADALKRKRLYTDEEHGANGQAVPMGSVATKATGKPVLNTKALRSVLKGKLVATSLVVRRVCTMSHLLSPCWCGAVFVVQAVPNYAQPW